MRIFPLNASRATAGAMVLGALVACNSSGPAATTPIRVHVGASPTAAGVGSTGPLALTSFRLSVSQASLGSGDQFGCVDCQGTDSGTSGAAAVLTIPLDGSPVVVGTELVGPGTYPAVEIEVGPPAAPPAGWAIGTSIELIGTYNGAPFAVALPIQGGFRETLAPPVAVPANGSAPATIDVTITLPVAAWFVGATGTALDPGNPTVRAEIEANIRRSFSPPEVGTGVGSEDGS